MKVLLIWKKFEFWL